MEYGICIENNLILLKYTYIHTRMKSYGVINFFITTFNVWNFFIRRCFQISNYNTAELIIQMQLD